MRGVVFTGDRQLELMTFPDPTPGPDEVVIEMKASGMCGSDLHQYRRPKAGGETGGLAAPSVPTIAGHEPCGIVAAVGTAVSPSLAQVGQRVMVHHYEGCRVCGHCRSGWSQLCQEVPVKVYGNNAHGGHAAYMKVPAFTVVPLPDELSFTTGAAISCGTGTAYGALRRIRLSGNDTIAIFGQGPVGLSATQLAAAMGARVIALDVSPERLARAKEFGAAEIVNPRSNDPVGAIKDLTHGYGAEFTLDTSSQPRRGACDQGVGHHLLCRRAQQRHDRRQPRHVEEAAHDRRVVDLLVDRPGGMRPLRRRSRHRCRGAVHPSLVARPGGRGLQIVRHADDRQRRVPDVGEGAMNDVTITTKPAQPTATRPCMKGIDRLTPLASQEQNFPLETRSATTSPDKRIAPILHFIPDASGVPSRAPGTGA